MASRPIPNDLLPWAIDVLPMSVEAGQCSFSVVAGDASNRRYFRLDTGVSTYIVAEAPPATEKNEAFVAVRNILADAGVAVPSIIGVDYERGYLLQGDLGSHTLLPALNTTTVDSHYKTAFAILDKMAKIDTQSLDLGSYDAALLNEELGRFPAWFVEELLNCPLDEEDRGVIERLNRRLVDSALEQPRVLVHRDFHSRNMLLDDSGGLSLIDFQDAVVGPVTYDLVSLLRDCYIRWPAQQVEQWALSYRAQLAALADVDEAMFVRWFDWMGLQRHIKVLGTFARLHLRDGKPGYLDDLPMVVAYAREILQKYSVSEPEFQQFLAWFQQRLSPLIASQPWSQAR